MEEKKLEIFALIYGFPMAKSIKVIKISLPGNMGVIFKTYKEIK